MKVFRPSLSLLLTTLLSWDLLDVAVVVLGAPPNTCLEEGRKGCGNGKKECCGDFVCPDNTCVPLGGPTPPPTTSAPTSDPYTYEHVDLATNCATNDDESFTICMDLIINKDDKPYFEDVIAGWTSVITTGVPDVANVDLSSDSINAFCGDSNVPHPTSIDDLYICGYYEEIDGSGFIYGGAQLIYIRENDGFPASGKMWFDSADVESLKKFERRWEVDRLGAVITHEIGHLLGIGSLWQDRNLATGTIDTETGYYSCTYAAGTEAETQYQDISGCTDTPPLQGSYSGHCAHWGEYCFRDEIMTPWLDGKNEQVVSKVTVGSLIDLGYAVNFDSGFIKPLTLNNECMCGSTRKLRGAAYEKDGIRVLEGDVFQNLFEHSEGDHPKPSEAGLARARAHGQQLLQAAANENANRPNPPGLIFVGDKYVSVLIGEGDYIFAIGVHAD